MGTDGRIYYPEGVSFYLRNSFTVISRYEFEEDKSDIDVWRGT